MFPDNSLKFLITITSLLLLHAGLWAQTDTFYVKDYYYNLVPRVLTNYKTQSIKFITKSNTLYSSDHFSTGDQHFIGAELSYRWASIGYNIGLTKENSTANTDFRFSTSYRPFRFQLSYSDLRNLNYSRVNGVRQQDTIFSLRQDHISLQNFGVKIDYVFNYKKISYSSSISQVGQQLKSRGSFILSAGISFQNIDLHGLSDSVGPIFMNRYNADRYKTIQGELGLGYTYNWVLTKKWVVSFSEIPNIGLQHIISSNSIYTLFYFAISINNYFRAGIIYTWKRYFIGAFTYNTLTAGKWAGFNYNNAYTSSQLHIGIVLEDPKDYFRN